MSVPYRYIFSNKTLVANNWLLLLGLSLVGASVGRWCIHPLQPWWLLGSTAFLSLFLLRSVVDWVLIKFINQAAIQYFLTWKLAANSERAWPNTPEFIRIRTILKQSKCRQLAVLTARVLEGIYAKQWIWDRADKKGRIQIFAYPLSRTKQAVCLQLSSFNTAGTVFITHNLFLPFGGYAPEHWDIKRYPFEMELSKLLAIHVGRVSGETLGDWSEEAVLPAVMESQKELKATNIERGFLFPAVLWPTQGLLTAEGRFRLWSELLCLRYIGVCF